MSMFKARNIERDAKLILRVIDAFSTRSVASSGDLAHYQRDAPAITTSERKAKVLLSFSASAVDIYPNEFANLLLSGIYAGDQAAALINGLESINSASRRYTDFAISFFWYLYVR